MSRLRAFAVVALVLLAARFGQTQDSPTITGVLPNQELRVSGLPVRSAPSDDSTGTLIAALEMIFHDPQVCCGRSSVLEGAALSARPLSLPNVGSKLQGKYVLDDNRRVVIQAEYLPANPVMVEAAAGTVGTAGTRIILSLQDNRPLLMEWNSRLYVLHGALFDEVFYDNGGRDYVIRKLFLFDPQFSDPRRETSFDRYKDDWAKVQGVLELRVMPQ